MSRVHTLTAFLAVGLHTLLALPWWLRLSITTQAPKRADTIEIPLDVVSERSPPKARRAAPPTVVAKAALPAAPQAAPAPPVPPHAASPAPAATASPTPEAPTKPAPAAASSVAAAPAILAAARALDGNADSVLLLHTAAFRSASVGKLLAERLRHGHVLAAFFTASALDPLADLEHVMIMTPRSPAATAAIAVLQYNVPRFKVRSAAARLSPLGDIHLIFPSPQILVLAAASNSAAESLPHTFRLPEPAGAEALELYVRAPSHSLAALVPDLPASSPWLELQLLLPVDGSAELLWRAPDATSPPDAAPLSGRTALPPPDLNAALATLLAPLR